MPSGRCMDCDTVHKIRVVGQRLGTRQCDWRPVEHEVVRHKACGSVVDRDEERDESVCRRCGPLDDTSSMRSERCDGVDKDIR